MSILSFKTNFLIVDAIITSIIIFALIISNACGKLGRMLLVSLLVIFLYLHFLAFVATSDDLILRAYLLGTFRPLGFLIGPLVYFYIASVTNPSLKLNWKDSVHLVPAFLCFMESLPTYFSSLDQKMLMLNSTLIQHEIRFQFSILVGVGLVYLVYSIQLLKNFEARIKQQYSSIDKWQLGWLKVCLLATSVTWAACLSYSFIGISQKSMFIFGIAFAGTTYLMAFTAIRRSILFNPILDKLELTQLPDSTYIENMTENDLVKRYDWSEEEYKDRKDKIANAMTEQKLYHNNKLRLRDLAETINVPEYIVSQIINIGFKKNFFDFVNSYRVQEAQKLLAKTNKADLNIIEVAYEVGFNSKSTFNSAFKRLVGRTPTEYRSNPEQSFQ